MFLWETSHNLNFEVLFLMKLTNSVYTRNKESQPFALKSSFLEIIKAFPFSMCIIFFFTRRMSGKCCSISKRKGWEQKAPFIIPHLLRVFFTTFFYILAGFVTVQFIPENVFLSTKPGNSITYTKGMNCELVSSRQKI